MAEAQPVERFWLIDLASQEASGSLYLPALG
jgi:hypothetical protein